MTLRLAEGLLAAGPLTRDSAQDAARRELSRQEYADARPSVVLRLIGRALRALGDLLDRAASGVGNGSLARALLLGVLALVVLVVLLRLGPLHRRPRGRGGLFDGSAALDAAGHRAAADALAARGHFAEAVRERLRAVVRGLEERGVLDARPGRTSGEVARDAGAAAPALAADLRRAVGVFDQVWYGGHAAGPDSYRVLVEVDQRVGAARLVTA